MRSQKIILIFGLLLFATNIWPTKLKVIETKYLITISKVNGLDSAVKITKGMPMYILDRTTTDSLIANIRNSPTSTLTSNFLIEYALNVKDNLELPLTMKLYFDKQIADSNQYKPDSNGWITRLDDDFYVALIKHKTPDLESQLISYYDNWFRMANEYKENYLKVLYMKDSRKRDMFYYPYVNVNEACYQILLALRDIKSTFATQERFQTHLKYLKFYQHSNLSAHIVDYSTVESVEKIHLSKSYKSLGELDIYNEPAIKRYLERYDDPNCSKYIWFNNSEGLMNLGCYSGPDASYGKRYKLKLIGDDLYIYLVYRCIS